MTKGPNKVRELETEVRGRKFQAIVGYHPVVEMLGDTFQFTEGPVWDWRIGHLLFTDIPTSMIFRWRPQHGFDVYRSDTNKANGLTLDGKGCLLVCEHASSVVSRIEVDGTRVVLASAYKGIELNSPNDIVVARNGGIFFTDPVYGRTADPWGLKRPERLGFRGLYHLHPDTYELTLIADDFDGPNGLCFSPDESRLYVNDSERQHIRVFEVSDRGELTGGKVWATTLGSAQGCPDGMKSDQDGNIYCCGPGGIHVFSSDGVCQGVMILPPMVTNFAFGGSDFRDLLVTATNRVCRIRVEVPGLPISSQVSKKPLTGPDEFNH